MPSHFTARRNRWLELGSRPKRVITQREPHPLDGWRTAFWVCAPCWTLAAALWSLL